MSKELQCDWIAWRVIGPTRLMLEMPRYNCCNMRTAILQAQSLMPTVDVIITQAGGVRDTIYRKIGHRWEAFDPNP